MTPHRRLILALAVATALAASGCTPEDPEPTPTPTGFASEQEAFAAAEATYRAYNEAENTWIANGEGEDPAEYMIGDLRQSELETRQTLEDAGLSFVGEFEILSFTGISASTIAGSTSVEAVVCMDSTDVILVDSDGNDVTPVDDEPLYALKVGLTTVDGNFRIHESTTVDAQC
ncbi:MAG: hypothetical protein QM607_07095 [Microbacterium sp.]